MTTIINLLEADVHAKRYGVTHKSDAVYSVTGKKVHNPTFPHRITVWDNTGRLNTTPDKWNEFSGKPGPGAYLDPSGKGTDAQVSFTLDAESVVIAAEPVQSGARYSREGLRPGDTVQLRYPDGTLSPELVVTTRYTADPVLIPA